MSTDAAILTISTADIRAYLARIGAKGGRVRSAAKAAACRANGSKPVRKGKRGRPVKGKVETA